MQGADFALDLPSKKRVLGVAGQALIFSHFVQGVDAHGTQGADLCQTDSRAIWIGKGGTSGEAISGLLGDGRQL